MSLRSVPFLIFVAVILIGLASGLNKTLPLQMAPEKCGMPQGGAFSTMIEARTDKGTPLTLGVADTSEERARGLSGRPCLPSHVGLLFLFPEDGVHGFWMKEMLFSIDIVWLNEKGTIVTIAERISPDTYPKVWYPEEKARAVVELSSGEVARLGLKKGDTLSFSF